MKKILLALLLALLLFSCKKEIDDEYFNSFQEQTVHTGNHYCGTCGKLNIRYFSGSVFKAYIRLDTSLLVKNEGGFQSKLCGFYEDNIHKNSCRISYHTIAGDSLELKTYVYNSWNRPASENKIITRISKSKIIEMLDSDGFIPVTITILKNQYLVKVSDIPEISLVRTCTLQADTIKYLTHHYYGGPDSAVAPHDMTLWIKYDESMR